MFDITDETHHVKPAPMPVEDLRRLLSYNPETGGFRWLVSPGYRTAAGSIAGTVASNGYVVIKIRGQLYKAHRIAWYISTGEWPAPGKVIDHVNDIKGDNRLSNLQVVTNSENQRMVLSRRKDQAPPEPKVGPRRFGRGNARPAPMDVETLRGILTYEPGTGLLRWARDCGGKDAKKIKAGAIAGCKSTFGYIVVRIAGVLYPAHRIGWYLTTGDWPPNQVDHINEVKADNRLVNLRLATHAQNQVNRKGSLPNTSGFRGVSRHGGKWFAQIGVNGNHITFPLRDTPEEAAADYARAARQYHGEFARTD